MPRLDEEFRDLVRRFNEAEIDYAVCGALALGFHGHPRATRDIDFIVKPESLFEAQRIVNELGFNIPAAPMAVADGALHIIRWSKIAPGDEDALMMDLLLLREDHAAHIAIELLPMDDLSIPVVTRDTLVYLKTVLSKREQDHVDIQRLLNNDVED